MINHENNPGNNKEKNRIEKVVERLYLNGIKNKALFELKCKEEQKIQKYKELENATFHPLINNNFCREQKQKQDSSSKIKIINPSCIIPSKSMKESLLNSFYMICNNEKQKEKYKINKIKNSRNNNFSNSRTSRSNKFVELYEDAKMRQTNAEKIKKNCNDNECTFRPTICQNSNLIINTNYDNKLNVIQRMENREQILKAKSM